MEDAVASVSQAFGPQGEHDLVRSDFLTVRNEPESNDLVGWARFRLGLEYLLGLHVELAGLHGIETRLHPAGLLCPALAERRDRSQPPLRNPLSEEVNRNDHQYAEREQHPPQICHFGSFYIAASWTASSMSTATRRETPGSCIVTPASWLMASIVVLLCVIRTN